MKLMSISESTSADTSTVVVGRRVLGLSRLRVVVSLVSLLWLGGLVTGHQVNVVFAAEEKAVSTKSSTQKTYKFLTELSKSKVQWQGTKIVGGGHEGDLMIKSGSMTFEGDKPVAAEVVMDMSTINCTDLKAGSSSKKKLEQHLKNEDFFDVASYPTAALKVNSFKHQQGDTYEVSGDITIRGVTKPITFTAEIMSAQTIKGSGSFEFDRVEFNVKYNSTQFFKSLGDKAINDMVKLSFMFEAEASI